MSQPFRSLPASDVARSLEELLLPRLAEVVRGRVPGHCMSILDLGEDLMVPLAKGIRRQVPTANVHVLADDRSAMNDDLHISSTKLVELRNPLPDGSLRPPLCVFLPANLRTSAEDSFGRATFEEFSVGEAYDTLRQRLLERTPGTLQGYAREFLQFLREQRWRWADSAAQVRYLLCAHANGNDGEAFGGALYELGLVPDFKLFDDAAAAYGRVRTNHDCVMKLTTGHSSVLGRVLDLDLASSGLQRRLSEYLGAAGIEDPVAWSREIVLDRKNWDLSFDKWEFTSEIAPERVTFVRVETDLPIVTDEQQDDVRLVDLIGQQVLTPSERRKMSVRFEVTPHPGQVRGLAYFTAQILSKDAGPVGAARKVKVWKVSRTHANVSLPRLNNVDFEEGWHHVHVQPWTADGDPIPIAEPVAQTGKRPNESEPFYVLPDAGLGAEPPQRSVPKADSIEHARLERQFTALLQNRETSDVAPHSVGWTQRSTKSRAAAQETIEAKFGKEGAFQISVARWLKNIEQRILEMPERLVSWRMQLHAGQPQSPTADVGEWTTTTAVRGFLDARSAYFRCVRQEAGDMVSQGLDLLRNAPLVVAYAVSYVDLVKDLAAKVESTTGPDQQSLIVLLREALAVDTVRLVIDDYRGQRREAALIAPTHPLRALWQLAWAQLGADWVRKAATTPSEHVTPARSALLQGLSSVNFPCMLTVSDGRVFTAVDNIHPFWPLYAPAGAADPRGLLGEVCVALGVQEPAIGGAAITGAVLASRMERYLIQHPYVRMLVVNAFNAGRASVLADALAVLQRREEFKDLRYDVRLFVPDPNAPGVGDSIRALVSGDAGASDAFAIASRSHIFPKLSVAVRATDDFRASPASFRSHLSLLFDLFPPEEVAAGPPIRTETMVALHGLVQDFAVRFHDDHNGVGWERQPRHGIPAAIDGGEEASLLLGELAALISAATATVARSTADFSGRPIIRLELSPAERALISEVHDASDWVFTIDRNMGIEFFDHGGRHGRRDRPDYLIDYTPSMVAGHGHRLIISSRSLAELEAILRPVLDEYGLEASERHAVLILDQLRSLSGRLALKLASAPTARAEALGIALARMFLEYQGALRNQIVVPLDSHVDLFHSAASQADAIGDEVSLRRTDLALFDLDLGARTISCNLVEVKCYALSLGLSGYGQLKERITEQLNQSERIIQRHFDPHRTTPDRPDRLIKTREFVTLLEFYLERALRYGLMEPAAGEEARAFLDRLEEGYALRFSRSGLVFDFDKPGTEPAESEVGIEFHRVGSDLIRRLVHQATEMQGQASATDEGDGSMEVSEGQERVVEEAAPPFGIPRLARAAFLVADRVRSTTDLGAGSLVPADSEARQSGRVSTGSAPTAVPSDGHSTSTEEEEPPPSGDSSTGTDETRVPVDHLGRQEREPSVSLAVEEPARATPAVTVDPAEGDRIPRYDSILGVMSASPQFGLLGEIAGRKVALDLNQTHTISLFGVQGGGKSYTLGSVIEMACMPIPGVNALPYPLAGVIFHYSSTLDYQPEFTSMALPNAIDAEVDELQTRYGATPRALDDVVILTPAAKVEERRAEYPGIEVMPIAFAAAELNASHWKFLMGAVGSQSMYIRQLALIMKRLRGELTLEAIRQAVQGSGLTDSLKDLAGLRLDFAEEYIDDACRLTEILRPGRLVIVDLRDEFIDKDEALGLFVVLLQMFADTTYQGRRFNKLVVFDEAHKYIGSPDLVAGLIEVVREMRHKGTSIMVASQDPPSVPTSLIELSTQIILHKFNSPAWLKHIQKANSALDALTSAKLSSLSPGEAYVWSSRATDDVLTRGASKVRCRPRITQHGGITKTAVCTDE